MNFLSIVQPLIKESTSTNAINVVNISSLFGIIQFPAAWNIFLFFSIFRFNIQVLQNKLIFKKYFFIIIRNQKIFLCERKLTSIWNIFFFFAIFTLNIDKCVLRESSLLALNLQIRHSK